MDGLQVPFRIPVFLIRLYEDWAAFLVQYSAQEEIEL